MVAEDERLVTESQVDARRLQETLFPRLDAEPAGLYLLADAAVAKYGRCRTL